MPPPRLPGILEYLRLAVGHRDARGVTDGQLLERFADQRDEAAFELLVWRHAKMVLGTCRQLLHNAHDAEDAFQACFLALAQRAGSISRRESVGGWLHKVALRLALTARGRQAKRTAQEQTLPHCLPTRVGPDPAQEAEQSEMRRALEVEVGRLPDKFRVPFVLCYLEGRSYAEAARELGCPLGTVESRLARARQRLSERLAQRGVVVSAGMFATLTAKGSVSASLIASTALAATLRSVSQAAASGLITTHVALLTEGVLRTMWMTKLTAVSALLVAVTLAGAGVGALSYRGSAAVPSAVPAVAKDDTKIARLIEQLGSDQFAEREKATKELGELGLVALEALRKAVKSDDAERRKRASDLLKQLEAQATRAEVLAPKRMRLVYKETPLTEAVADFKKKSGYDLVLQDPDGKLKERTVTLDTGEVTFWRALALFCEKAGLDEVAAKAGLPAPPRIGGGFGGGAGGLPALPPAGGGGGAGVPAAPGGGVVQKAGALPAGGAAPAGGGFVAVPGRATVQPNAVNPGQIVLTEGKPRALPTDDTTAARFRALDKTDAVGKPAAGEILLALEVSLEPRLGWQELVAVKVAQAADKEGQSLEQVTLPANAVPAIGVPLAPGLPAAPGAGALPPPVAAARMVAGGGMGRVVGFTDLETRSRVIAVRLKQGAKASTALQELSGTVTARVLTEAKALLVVDDVLKSAGKPVKGAEAGSVHVRAVQNEGNGRHTIRMELELPGGAANSVAHRSDRIVLGHRAVGAAQYELSLADANGNLLPPAGVRLTAGAKGVELVVTTLSRPGQGAPLKLTIGERKSVSVELPFTLKNVPLP